VVFAILVAFFAFVAGLELGGPRLPALAQVTPVDVAPSIALSPSVIVSTVSPGPPSRFAEAFAPKLLLDGLPGGSDCVTQTAGFSGSGQSPSAPRLVRVWLTSCPIPVPARRAFLDALVASLEAAIPYDAHNTEADSRGMSIEEFPYTAGGSPGTVIVAADASRSSLLLGFTLEEHVPHPIP
jgi:hypothetical protein